MPQVKGFIAVAAGGSAQPDLGQFDRVGGRGAVVELYASALAGAAGDLNASLFMGSDTSLLNGGLGVKAGGPTINEDQVAQGVGFPGDKIQVRFDNPSIAAQTVGFTVVIKNG